MLNEIDICIGLHCKRKGYKELLEEFERVLGIKAGQTTEDGRFKLNTSGCVGSCRQALALTMNGKMYRHVEVGDVESIIDTYK